MKIGFSIFLLALGAILTWAVDYTVAGVNIHIVGWILMVAGALGLIITLMVFMPRDRRAGTSVPPGTAGEVTGPTQTPTSVRPTNEV